LISRKAATLREAAKGFKLKYCAFDLNFEPLREVEFGKLDHYRLLNDSSFTNYFIMNRIAIIRSAFFLIIVILCSFESWAKEKGATMDITINKEDSLWYYLPWIWVIGGAIFILLLVAMIRTSQKRPA
jgi:hypothetical protein